MWRCLVKLLLAWSLVASDYHKKAIDLSVAHGPTLLSRGLICTVGVTNLPGIGTSRPLRLRLGSADADPTTVPGIVNYKNIGTEPWNEIWYENDAVAGASAELTIHPQGGRDTFEITPASNLTIDPDVARLSVAQTWTAKQQFAVGIDVSDGSAVNPQGVAFISEPQLGFYKPAAGQFGWAQGGVGRALFDFAAAPMAFRPFAGQVVDLGSPAAPWGDLHAGPNLLVRSNDGTLRGRFFYDSVNMQLRSETGQSLVFVTANTARWNVVDSTGHFIASTDNVNDIGANSANRPRTGYFGTSVVIGTDPGGAAQLRVGGAAAITTELQWWNASVLRWGIALSGLGGLQVQPKAGAGNTNVFFLDSSNNVRASLDASTGTLILSADPGGSGILRGTGGFRLNYSSTVDTSVIQAATSPAANILRIQDSLGQYRWRVDQAFSMVLTDAAAVDRFSVFTNGVTVIGSPDPGGTELLRSAGDFRLNNYIVFVGASGFITANGGAGTSPGRIRFNQGSPAAVEVVTADNSAYAPFRVSRFYLSEAASRIVPGATSFSNRNSADSADNLLILDAGDATFRTKVTLPGPLTFTTAVSKIVPGATSFAIRDTADSQDVLAIPDGGPVKGRAGTSTVVAPFSEVLYQNRDLQTTSAAEVSLATYTLKANTLDVNGKQLRITIAGDTVPAAAQLLVKFGATYVLVLVHNAGAGGNVGTTIITRLTNVTQYGDAIEVNGTAITTDQRAPAETLSADVTIDFRAKSDGATTTRMRSVLVELLAA